MEGGVRAMRSACALGAVISRRGRARATSFSEILLAARAFSRAELAGSAWRQWPPVRAHGAPAVHASEHRAHLVWSRRSDAELFVAAAAGRAPASVAVAAQRALAASRPQLERRGGVWSEAEREGLSRCLLKFGTVRWRRAFEALREEQPSLQHAAGDALDVCCHLLFQWLTHVTPSSAAEQREVEADRAYGAGQCAWLLNEARGGHGGAPLDEQVIAGGLRRLNPQVREGPAVMRVDGLGEDKRYIFGGGDVINPLWLPEVSFSAPMESQKLISASATCLRRVQLMDRVDEVARELGRSKSSLRSEMVDAISSVGADPQVPWWCHNLADQALLLCVHEHGYSAYEPCRTTEPYKSGLEQLWQEWKMMQRAQAGGGEGGEGDGANEAIPDGEWPSVDVLTQRLCKVLERAEVVLEKVRKARASRGAEAAAIEAILANAAAVEAERTWKQAQGGDEAGPSGGGSALMQLPPFVGGGRDEHSERVRAKPLTDKEAAAFEDERSKQQFIHRDKARMLDVIHAMGLPRRKEDGSPDWGKLKDLLGSDYESRWVCTVAEAYNQVMVELDQVVAEMATFKKNKQEKKQALQVEGAAAGAAGPVSGVESMDVEADGAAKTREDRFKCPRWMSFQKAKVARERVEMFDVLQEALRLHGDWTAAPFKLNIGSRARLPDWWHPGEHDREFALAALKHGVGRCGAIWADPQFSFAAAAAAAIAAGAAAGVKSCIASAGPSSAQPSGGASPAAGGQTQGTLAGDDAAEDALVEDDANADNAAVGAAGAADEAADSRFPKADDASRRLRNVASHLRRLLQTPRGDMGGKGTGRKRQADLPATEGKPPRKRRAKTASDATGATLPAAPAAPLAAATGLLGPRTAAQPLMPQQVGLPEHVLSSQEPALKFAAAALGASWTPPQVQLGASAAPATVAALMAQQQQQTAYVLAVQQAQLRQTQLQQQMVAARLLQQQHAQQQHMQQLLGAAEQGAQATAPAGALPGPPAAPGGSNGGA